MCDREEAYMPRPCAGVFFDPIKLPRRFGKYQFLMPYTVQTTKHGPYRKFSGHVTMDELLTSLSEVQTAPGFDSFKFTISDFLDVKSYEFTEFDLLKYRAQVRGGEYLNSGLISGLVVTDPEIIELLKTRYEAFSNYTVEYFSTLDTCVSWIENTTGKTVLLD
jgi:hypothetical protein